MEFVLFFLLLLLLDLAALRWGADSREEIDSPEWERRRASCCTVDRYPGQLDKEKTMDIPRFSAVFCQCIEMREEK